MENQIKNIQMHNDEIDLKNIFKIIFKYKYIIIFFAIIFGIISAYFAYTKPNVYSSYATIELQDDEKSWNANDALKRAFTGGTVNIQNQIEIFKSKSLANKAIKYLNSNTRYFTKNNHRIYEFYQNSPFIAIDKFIGKPIYGKRFYLTPIDEKSFRLEIKPISKFSKRGLFALLKIKPLMEDEKITYNKIHNYDEYISNEWFSIKIKKITSLEDKEYSFSFIHPYSAGGVFYKNLSVTQVSEFASILQISIQDSVSLRAKDLLNNILKAYIEQEIQRKTETANLSLDFIDNQLDKINKRLKKSESNLESYKESNDVISLSDKAQTTSRKLVEYESKLQELSIEENILKNLSQYISNNQNLSGLTVGSVNFADPALATLIKNIHELASQKKALLIDYTELHPDVEKLSKTISSLREQIIASLNNNLRQINQRKKSLNRLVYRYKKSLETLPKQERELTRLSRYFTVNEKVYSFLLEKRAETAILRSSTISNARILDKAENFSSPIKPKRSLIVLVGIILGIILGLAFAFLKEFFDNTIKNSDEIESLTTLPIYGIIPDKKNDKKHKLLDEAFRSIRTNLQFLPKHDKSKIITITSSVSGEGKTTVAKNLANVIAQANKKVLLIDLDLRKADIHKMFTIANNIGITNYLTKQNSLDEITHKINVCLDIITTGSLPPNPSELILSERMRELIDNLKEKYDYIIFDTPPVGLVTDALILINYSDISFLITKASYTRKEFVKNLDTLAKEHKNNTFGIILNGVEIGEKYGYGYGSNYGYGYGNEEYYKNR